MSATETEEATAASGESDADREAIAAANASGEGTSIEDLAAAADEEEEETPPTQMAIEGYGASVTLAVGGTTPDKSQVSIMSASRDVKGQFKKGDTVRLEVVAKVVDISFPDTTDSFGNVTSTARRHKLRPIVVKVLTDDGA